MVCQVAVTSMKGRIETGHLKDLRRIAQERADRRQVEGLMQRREVRVPLQAGQNVLIDAQRAIELGTTVHDAVADGTRRDVELVAQPRSRNGKRLGDVWNGLDPILAIDQHGGLTVHRPEFRPAADSIHLPLDRTLQARLAGQGKDLELDARGSGVDNEDRIHRVHAALTIRARRRASA